MGSHVYFGNQNLYEPHRKMACLVIYGKRGAGRPVHPLGRVGSLMSVVYGIVTLISDLERSGLLLNCEEGCAGFCLLKPQTPGTRFLTTGLIL